MSSPSSDPFADVRVATTRHRSRHGCGAYTYKDGALLGALAAAVDAQRILELGTALGYTALWLAHGAPDAMVDTIERDAEHVRLAREHAAAHGLEKRVTVHEGDFNSVLRTLEPGYDLIFFDGFTPAPPMLATLRRLLRPRGVLVSANLNHGGTANAYCDEIFGGRSWLSAFVNAAEETAISVKL